PARAPTPAHWAPPVPTTVHFKLFRLDRVRPPSAVAISRSWKLFSTYRRRRRRRVCVLVCVCWLVPASPRDRTHRAPPITPWERERDRAKSHPRPPVLTRSNPPHPRPPP